MSSSLILVLAVIAVWFTWPLAVRAGEILPGHSYRFDQYILAYALEWVRGSLLSGTVDFFNANACHPARNALAGSDHLLGFLPLFALLRAFGVGSLASLHLLVVISAFASALAMAALLLRLSEGDRAAAAVGGVLFAFTPYQMAAMGMWLHVTAVFCLPLIVLAIDRLLDGDRRAPALLGSVALVQVALGVYGTVFAFLTGVAYLGGRLLIGRARLRPAALVLAGVSVLPAAALALGIAGRYAAVAPHGARLDLTTAIRNNIVDQQELLDPLDGPRGLATRLGRLLGITVQRRSFPPHAGRPALVLALVAVGAWLLGRDRTACGPSAGLAAITMTGLGLALGPGFLRLGDLVLPLPILWLDQVPFFGHLRGAERFMSVAAVGLTAFAALGLHALLKGRSRPLRLAGSTLVIVLARFDAGAMPFGDLPTVRTTPAEILSREGDGSPVLELPPLGLGDRLGAALLLAAKHRQPTTLCLTGVYPPAWRALFLRVGVPPDSAQLLQVLGEGGFRWLMIHKGLGFDAIIDVAAPIGRLRYEDESVVLFERGSEWRDTGRSAEGPARPATLRLTPVVPTPRAGSLTPVRTEVTLPETAGDGSALALTLRWKDEAGKPVLHEDEPIRAARRRALPVRWQRALEPLRVLPAETFPVPRGGGSGVYSGVLLASTPRAPGRYVLEARLHPKWVEVVMPYEEPPAVAAAVVAVDVIAVRPNGKRRPRG